MSHQSTALSFFKKSMTGYSVLLSGCIVYCFLGEIDESYDAVAFVLLLASAMAVHISMRRHLDIADKANIIERRDLKIKHSHLQTIQQASEMFQHSFNTASPVADSSKAWEDEVEQIKPSVGSFARPSAKEAFVDG